MIMYLALSLVKELRPGEWRAASSLATYNPAM